MVQLVIVLASVCVLLFIWYYQTSGKNGPPVYKGCLPFLGHIFILLKSYNTELLMNTVIDVSNACVKSGGVIRFYLFNSTYYVISDPEDAQAVAKACIKKHYFYYFAKNWMGNGMITASGALWKKHRKLLSPSFSLQLQLSYLETLNNQAKILLERIDDKAHTGPFDPSIYFRRLTFENLFLTSLGLPIDKDDDYCKKYLKTVDEILQNLMSRFWSVIFHSDYLYEFSSLKKKEDKLLEFVNELTEEVIKRKREFNFSNNNKRLVATKTSGVKETSFLDLLLELSDEGVMTDEEVKDEINTVITASLDTTSWILNNTLVLLGTYPHVQDKVCQELQDILGDNNRDVNKDDLHRLVYLEAVIKETLRLYTTGPIALRTLDEEVKLKNYTLPSGSHCILSIYGLHRSGCWGEDKDTYRPERWLEQDAQRLIFGGFSLGRRVCIGKTYAMITLKTTLAHFLRRYRVYGNAGELKFKLDFIMKPKSGNCISIERR